MNHSFTNHSRPVPKFNRSITATSLFSIFCVLLTSSTLFFASTEQASAQTPCGLVITEIMPMSSSNEWIEVFNNGAVDVDLSGYVIGDYNSDPSDPIGSYSIPAGKSAILYNNAIVSDSSFESEWGAASDVELIPVTFASNASIGAGGDIIALWESSADYNLDDTDPASSGSEVLLNLSQPNNACSVGIYSSVPSGTSVFLNSITADGAKGESWTVSTQCQGTAVYNTFTSNLGNIGSPNGVGDGTCYPTITSSNPADGSIDNSINSGNITVEFSQEISISDTSTISLICADPSDGSSGSIGNISPLSFSPTQGTPFTTLSITFPSDLTAGFDVERCTLSIDKDFVEYDLKATNPIPDSLDLEFSFLTVGGTLVELDSFTAQSNVNGSGTLQWITAAEIDNAGFNLYASDSAAGPWKKVNRALIAAKGSATAATTYRFDSDSSASYYQLEDIDLNGKSTIHGPVRTDGASQAANTLTPLYLPFIQITN